MYDNLDVETQHLEYEVYWTSFHSAPSSATTTDGAKSPRKLSLAVVLFFLNRYGGPRLTALLLIVIDQLNTWTSDSQLCYGTFQYHEWLIIAVQAIVAIIAVLRMYALYWGRSAVVAILSPIVFIIFVYGLYAILMEKIVVYSTSDLPRYGCQLPITIEMAPGFMRGWIAHLCFDLLVFSMTLYTAVKFKFQGSILGVIVRNGTLYFGIMALSTISVILSYPAYLRGATATLTNVLSSTMISRLLLNLRRYATKEAEMSKETEMRSTISQLVFEIGSNTAPCDGDEEIREEGGDALDIVECNRYSNKSSSSSV
ncbi:hypothetical protein CPB84DRAFT_1751793 [Gymnopilus junonius]|uniref:Uncharacterized protein n=1 Tax=Gymnopilus junonius TaxID=109634 RepID=A0A9P5NCX5_GYMJU|nr:hypothetical protein CPB84DRAFT_1751793 [Gymnopilus junonius]